MVCSSQRWISSGSFPESLNNTITVLIPKCDKPSTLKDLMPILLCNIIYKVVARVLANRPKSLLDSIVSPSQYAFVPVRLIIDNVMLAFEVIHHMKCKSHGKKGEVALKIDISKSYNRVDWTYLKNVMLQLGFAQRFVDLIILCITTINYSVMLNGAEFGPISPNRGLR